MGDETTLVLEETSSVEPVSTESLEEETSSIIEEETSSTVEEETSGTIEEETSSTVEEETSVNDDASLLPGESETGSVDDIQPNNNGAASSGNDEDINSDLMDSLLSSLESQNLLLADQVELIAEQQQQYDALLASSLKQEKQLEACISILLIFVVVGLLNYIYKFFKIFF